LDLLRLLQQLRSSTPEKGIRILIRNRDNVDTRGADNLRLQVVKQSVHSVPKLIKIIRVVVVGVSIAMLNENWNSNCSELIPFGDQEEV